MNIKGALHVQSWCLADQTYCIFDVLVAVAVAVAVAVTVVVRVVVVES